MKKRSQIDEQKLLEMADRFDEDEFGNLTLFFNTTVGVVRLNRCRLDGDTSVQVTVPTQIDPLVFFELIGCNEMVAVSDERGEFVEFVGHQSLENYSRGALVKRGGFRLRLKPYLSVEPFYSENPS